MSSVKLAHRWYPSWIDTGVVKVTLIQKVPIIEDFTFTVIRLVSHYDFVKIDDFDICRVLIYVNCLGLRTDAECDIVNAAIKYLINLYSRFY